MTETSKKRLCLLVAAAALAVEAAEKDMVQGDKGKWQVEWHGISLPTKERTSQSEVFSLLTTAMNAATVTNWQQFTNCFHVAQTKESVTQITNLFQEWGATSKDFLYLAGAEARLIETNGEHSAVISFVPVAQRGAIKTYPTNDANAVFAEKIGSYWKFVTAVPDQSAYQHVLERVKPFRLRRDTVLINSQEDFKNWVTELNHQEIKQLQQKGVPRDEIAARQLTHQLSRDAVSIRTWSDWTNYFKPTILAPPFTFDTVEPFDVNFRDPVSALRSHLRALLVGDAETLLRYSDASGGKWLEDTLGVDPANKKPTYKWLTNVTHVSVLMTVERIIGEQKYVLILVREQDRFQPKEKVVVFQVRLFLQNKGDFLFTRDLSMNSFTSPLAFANAEDANVKRYPIFLEGMRKSELPPHFYTID